MARKVYRVLLSGTNWQLKYEGTVSSTYTTKPPAVSARQATAKADQPSQLVVHKADGTIECEYTYGDDPYPPKG